MWVHTAAERSLEPVPAELLCTAAAHSRPSHPIQLVQSCLQLPAAEFAYSMGLPTAPKLRFLKKAGGAVHTRGSSTGWAGPLGARFAAIPPPHMPPNALPAKVGFDGPVELRAAVKYLQ